MRQEKIETSVPDSGCLWNGKMIAIPDQMDKISTQHQGLYLNPIDHRPYKSVWCVRTIRKLYPIWGAKAVQIFQVCV